MDNLDRLKKIADLYGYPCEVLTSGRTFKEGEYKLRKALFCECGNHLTEKEVFYETCTKCGEYSIKLL